MRTFLCLVLALTLPACAVTIGEADPRPNVLLGQSPQHLVLAFADAVPDAMGVPVDSSNVLVTTDVSVEKWHETLSRGFHNGFDRYFAKTGPTSTLEVLVATPKMFLTPKVWTARVTYQAQLVDEHGNVVHRFAGTGLSPIPITSLWVAEPALAGAVESMYEQIAAQMPSAGP